MRRIAAGFTCVSIIALAASAALAQPVAQPPRLTTDIAGFDGDPSALPRAIAAIEQASGGVVVEARYANVEGAPGYDAAVAHGGTITIMRFARPEAGVLTLTDATAPIWLQHWRARRDIHIAAHAPVSLEQAVLTAEKTGGGAPAVAAGIATSASNPTSDVHAYNVLLDDHGAVRRVAIDSATGAPIADPSSLAGWP